MALRYPRRDSESGERATAMLVQEEDNEAVKISLFFWSQRQSEPDRKALDNMECGGAANQQLCTAQRAKQRVNSKEKENNNHKNNERG
jgi:hypothetical protein